PLWEGTSLDVTMDASGHQAFPLSPFPYRRERRSFEVMCSIAKELVRRGAARTSVETDRAPRALGTDWIMGCASASSASSRSPASSSDASASSADRTAREGRPER